MPPVCLGDRADKNERSHPFLPEKCSQEIFFKVLNILLGTLKNEVRHLWSDEARGGGIWAKGTIKLSVDEQNQLHRGLNTGQSFRALSGIMNRSAGTLSWECHLGSTRQSYDAVHGRDWVQTRRRRGPCRLLLESPLTGQVHAQILERTEHLHFFSKVVSVF